LISTDARMQGALQFLRRMKFRRLDEFHRKGRPDLSGVKSSRDDSSISERSRISRSREGETLRLRRASGGGGSAYRTVPIVNAALPLGVGDPNAKAVQQGAAADVAKRVPIGVW
jgi:hypothetical protein